MNVQAIKWLADNRNPSDYQIVRLEDMCGDSKEDVANSMLKHVLGLSHQNDAAKTVSEDKCRLNKYKVRCIGCSL